MCFYKEEQRKGHAAEIDSWNVSFSLKICVISRQSNFCLIFMHFYFFLGGGGGGGVLFFLFVLYVLFCFWLLLSLEGRGGGA